MKLRDGGAPPRQRVPIPSRGPQSLGPDVRPALSLRHRERPRAQRKIHVDPYDRLSAWSRPPLRGRRTLPQRSRRGGCRAQPSSPRSSAWCCAQARKYTPWTRPLMEAITMRWWLIPFTLARLPCPAISTRPTRRREFTAEVVPRPHVRRRAWLADTVEGLVRSHDPRRGPRTRSDHHLSQMNVGKTQSA